MSRGKELERLYLLPRSLHSYYNTAHTRDSNNRRLILELFIYRKLAVIFRISCSNHFRICDGNRWSNHPR
jgi:hypothetical protein